MSKGVIVKNQKLPCRLKLHGVSYELVTILYRDIYSWVVLLKKQGRNTQVTLKRGGDWEVLAAPNLPRDNVKENSVRKREFNSGEVPIPNNKPRTEVKDYNDFIKKAFSGESYEVIISLPWTDIVFYDGKINYQIDKFDIKTLTVRRKWMIACQVDSSKAVYNKLKSIFMIRNAEPIRLHIVNNIIKEVDNIEVLDYYFLILKNSQKRHDFTFGEGDKIATVYRKFTRNFYRDKLKSILKDNFINFLCEIALNELPIVPVTEHIVNASGGESYHMSLLFPLGGGDKIYWCWEGLADGKATYIFESTKLTYIDDAQNVYNFITGDTVNKRSALTNSYNLRRQLRMVKKLSHKDYTTWSKSVSRLSEG